MLYLAVYKNKAFSMTNKQVIGPREDGVWQLYEMISIDRSVAIHTVIFGAICWYLIFLQTKPSYNQIC